MYRIVIDRSLCSGFGACAELAPDIFELDDGGARLAPRRDQHRRRRRSTRPPPARWARSPSSRSRRHDAPRTVVIVGAGLAGARAAETLRAEGFAARVVLVGDEPVRALRAARALEGVPRGHARRGVAAAAPAGVLGRARHRARARATASSPIDPARGAHGRAAAASSRSTRSSSRPVRAPRRLPLAMPTGVHELRTLADARALREALAPAPARRRRRRLRRRRGRVDRARARRRGDDRRGRRRAARTRARRRRRACCSPSAGAPTASTCASAPASSGFARITQRPRRVGQPRRRQRARADAVLVGIGVEPARELLPDRPASTSLAAGDVVGPGPLDRGGPRRRCGGAPDPRPPRRAAAAALRLVGPVRPAPPDRRHAAARPTASSWTATAESFAVRYLDARRADVRRAAREPAGEAAALRRELCEAALPLRHELARLPRSSRAPCSWRRSQPPRSRSTCSCSAASRRATSRSDG